MPPPFANSSGSSQTLDSEIFLRICWPGDGGKAHFQRFPGKLSIQAWSIQPKPETEQATAPVSEHNPAAATERKLGPLKKRPLGKGRQFLDGPQDIGALRDMSFQHKHTGISTSGMGSPQTPSQNPEPRRHETKMPMFRKLWQPHPNCSQNYVSNLNNSSQSSGQRGPFFHAQAWNSRSPSSWQKVFAARTRDCSAILNVLLSPLCNIKDRLQSNSRMHRGNYAMCNLPTTNKNP